jgi:spore maturation protein CgeB
MRIVLFCHSLRSDWNHGNAHFLRGVCSELAARGHDVRVFEPADAWSARSLAADEGTAALSAFQRVYPALAPIVYDPSQFDLEQAVDAADLVIVHEWNPHDLVENIGRLRARGAPFTLLFHDTHHRSVSEAQAMAAYDLRHYDGVLAFGEVIRERYVALGWSRRAWTWHDAADTNVFRPLRLFDPGARPSDLGPRTSHLGPRISDLDGDLVWIGNWGDGERSEDLRQYLVEPVRDLGLRARVHGVRYPAEALATLSEAGIAYAGWLANFDAPAAYARFAVTVHVPRRPYVESLPGIPTIRVFEALACGIPLVSCWWEDREGLFTEGRDFLMARSPAEMRRRLRDVLNDRALAAALARHGRETVLARHTCAHRVDELLAIVASCRPDLSAPAGGGRPDLSGPACERLTV